MDSFSFWKSWPDAHRRWWTVMALLFVSIGCLAVFAYIIYPAPVFTWQQLQDLQEQELTLHTFQSGGFNFSLIGDNYIVFERWLGNEMKVNLFTLDVYLGAFLLAMVMILSIVSALPRYWFMISAGILLFLVSTFQIEGLALFGMTNKIPVGMAILLLLGPGIYFQFANRNAMFSARLLTHVAVMVLFCLWLVFSARVANPIHYFALNTMPAAIVIFSVLCVMIAHEIVAIFVWMSSQVRRSSGSLRDFLIISGVYLLNLWLTYLDRIGTLDWSYGLPAFWLLMISLILSVWGIQARRPQWENIFSDDILPVYLTLSLGAVMMALMGFFYSTSNDAALLAVEDIVLYAHIGYGMMFVVYVLSNFMGLMAKNLPVFKVLYKPTAMPYFSFRLAGLIFTLALLFYNRWMVPVNHFISGYYTGWGDYYIQEGDPLLAEGYYQRAHFYAPYNQHSATMLSMLEDRRGNVAKADGYAKDANLFHPTEFTLLNEANRVHEKGNSLKELLYLRDANKIYPGSAIIRNSLGQSFARVGMKDSALRYFASDLKDSRLKSTANLNMLGLLAKSRFKVRPDSLSLLLTGDERTRANALAVANAAGIRVKERPGIPKDSVLSLFTATEIGNYITNQIGESDTTFLEVYLKVARLDTNRYLKDKILVPAAHASYAQGKLNKAFELLQEVIFSGEEQGRHNTTLALWCMDQGKPEVAIIHLLYAINQRSPQAPIIDAMAQAETGQLSKSLQSWENIIQSPDTTARSLAEGMIKVLRAKPEDWHQLSPKEQYQFVHFRMGLEDSMRFRKMARQIADEDWRARAFLEQSRRWFAMDELGAAWNDFSELQGTRLKDLDLFTELKYFELRLLTARGRWDLVEAQLKKGANFGPYRETEHMYFEALRQEKAGDLASAQRSYTWLGNNNPYFDEGVVAAAGFFFRQQNKLKAYHILSEALQVNGRSVKILKAYIPVALENGFDDFAAGAFDTLKEILPPKAMDSYVKQYHLEGLLLQ